MSEQNQSQAAPGATDEARPATEDRAYVPDTVGVYGGGRMGAGIAQVAAQAGYQVVLRDLEQTFLERGLGSIRRSIGKLLVSEGRGGRGRGGGVGRRE